MSDTEVELRKAQEALANIRNGGAWKEIIRFQREVFLEYVNVGFTDKQSIEFTKQWFFHDKT